MTIRDLFFFKKFLFLCKLTNTLCFLLSSLTQYLPNFPVAPKKSIFSTKKYSNLFFVKNGGWHFTCIRTPEELEKKLLNFAHHYEYEESGLKIGDLKKFISEKRVMYDHNVDQRGYKWSGKSILKKIDNKDLPKHIETNLKEYDEWLD